MIVHVYRHHYAGDIMQGIVFMLYIMHQRLDNLVRKIADILYKMKILIQETRPRLRDLFG